MMQLKLLYDNYPTANCNLWSTNVGIKNKTLPKISDINSTGWVYPIEPWGHLMYSLNIEATDDYANFFENIPIALYPCIAESFSLSNSQHYILNFIPPTCTIF